LALNISAHFIKNLGLNKKKVLVSSRVFGFSPFFLLLNNLCIYLTFWHWSPSSVSVKKTHCWLTNQYVAHDELATDW